ncbi:MAG: BlaI/MecI/CopY family transcriptional regulator [Candidatus Eisenbacteria bacterium]
MREPVQLSELQIAILRSLWRRGEASVADVAQELQAERALAHTTVATLLTRLEKRGVVTHRLDGRQLVYRALVTEDAVRTSMVADLLESLFQGDAKALVAHLVREDELAPGDLEKLRARLKAAKRD